ncbi:hypothetical protein NIES2104_32560 [Leptolyngbya sp. NIES-2104]|nr:hypothetical protein NIES2104_32560 [Leptolyngbya sp. NIES-2104]
MIDTSTNRRLAQLKAGEIEKDILSGSMKHWRSTSCNLR